MTNNRIPVAVFAAVAAMVIGGAVTGCNKSGSSVSQSSTSSAASGSSSSASSSASQSTSAKPGGGQTVKSSNGSFSVVLPAYLKVETDNQGEDMQLQASGQDDKALLLAGKSKPDERGATCKESIDKAMPDITEFWNATVDPSGIETLTVDDEQGARANMTFHNTEKSFDTRGGVLCARHGADEYALFFMADPATADADFSTIVDSWKWS
jgi:hypothetical protein